MHSKAFQNRIENRSCFRCPLWGVLSCLGSIFCANLKPKSIKLLQTSMPRNFLKQIHFSHRFVFDFCFQLRSPKLNKYRFYIIFRLLGAFKIRSIFDSISCQLDFTFTPKNHEHLPKSDPKRHSENDCFRDRVVEPPRQPKTAPRRPKTAPKRASKSCENACQM